MNLHKENKQLKKQNAELTNKASLIYITNELENKFSSSVIKMDNTYEHYKKSFHDQFKEENCLLKDIIKKFENEALEEVKGPAFESGCDFLNFVIPLLIC